MSQGIPLATPYPWAPSEKQITHPVSRKRKGSGLLVLNQALQDTCTSKRAKNILQSLLGGTVTTGGANDDTYRLATVSLLTNESAPPLQTIDPSSQLQDETLLEMAQNGRFSLLGSILRVITESPTTPVSTKHILRTCSLAVRPGDVPPQMDAKEMILAALFFLSSTHRSEHWELPLILPTNVDVDLEKRSYEPVEFSPSESQLQWLETAFLKSPGDFMGREKYCPRLKRDEEVQLLLKGTLPTSATPKSAGTKRRSTASKQAASAAATLST
jgi:hypothetical protein